MTERWRLGHSRRMAWPLLSFLFGAFMIGRAFALQSGGLGFLAILVIVVFSAELATTRLSITGQLVEWRKHGYLGRKEAASIKDLRRADWGSKGEHMAMQLEFSDRTIELGPWDNPCRKRLRAKCQAVELQLNQEMLRHQPMPHPPQPGSKLSAW